MRDGAEGTLKRRAFLVGTGLVVGAAALGLGGGEAAAAEAEGEGAGEFTGPEVEPKRTVEVLCFDRWVPLDSMGSLWPGAVFRLREPDGTLVDKGEVCVAAGAPYKTAAGGGKGSKCWTWGVAVEDFGKWTLEKYGQYKFGIVPGLEAVYLATMPDPFPDKVKDQFGKVAPEMIRPGALVLMAHFEGYPWYVPTPEIERLMLDQLKDCPNAFIYTTAMAKYLWGAEGVPTCIPNEAVPVWQRHPVFIARYAMPGVYLAQMEAT